jgi:hypothetical protein
MSSWGKRQQASDAPKWAVNASVCKADPSAKVHARPTQANVGFLLANTIPSAYITNETVGLYLVANTNIASSGDKVVDVSIIDGGSGYLEVPAVAFSGGGGSGAAATASIAGGKVTQIIVTNTGSSYETVPAVSVFIARRTIATSSVTTSSDKITYVGHGLNAGDQILYRDNGAQAMTPLSNNVTYFVASAGLTSDVFEVSSNTTIITPSNVAVSGSAGQFTCDATTLAIGNRIKITGAVSATVASHLPAGYANNATGTVYYVSAVTGSSPNVTGFTLKNEDNSAATTTAAGVTTGATFAAEQIVNITNVGNDAQWFNVSNSTRATAIADKGLGENDAANTLYKHATHSGWNLKTVGTGGRAGRVQWETLVAQSSARPSTDPE